MNDFFKQFGIASFYGAMKEETVDSLLLSILPGCNFDFSQDLSEVTESKEDDSTNVFESIIQALQLRTGLRFPMVIVYYSYVSVFFPIYYALLPFNYRIITSSTYGG